MGGQLSLIAPSASTISIEAYVSELGDIQYEKNLGNARFLKTLKGLHEEGMVVVKVLIKPTPAIKLDQVGNELISM
jgi:phosphoinositide-3-kinase regulatory subunit 4